MPIKIDDGVEFRAKADSPKQNQALATHGSGFQLDFKEVTPDDPALPKPTTQVEDPLNILQPQLADKEPRRAPLT